MIYVDEMVANRRWLQRMLGDWTLISLRPNKCITILVNNYRAVALNSHRHVC